jgi:hypothetical protein
VTITSITELVTARTADQITTEELAALTASGFPVDAWQSGGAARSLLRADALALATAEGIVAKLAKGAYGSTAADAGEGWLDLFMQSRFSLDRIEATYAVGQVVLTVPSGAGPFSVPAGGLLVTDGTLRWRSTETITTNVTSAAPVTFSVRAELSGIGGNAANGTVTRIISPALPGATCNNPVIGATSTWLELAAIDREGDVAYLARGRARWATLGSGFTEAAAAYWCRSATIDGTPTGANAGCTRIAFGPPAGDGSYTVYVASATTTLPGPAVVAVQAELDLRKPITDTPTVVAATVTTITVSGTVAFRGGFNTSANQILVAAAIRAFVDALDIGAGDGSVFVDSAGIAAAIYMAVPGGVADVDLTAPTTDTTITAGRVAVADTAGLTFT